VAAISLEWGPHGSNIFEIGKKQNCGERTLTGIMAFRNMRCENAVKQ